MHTPVKVIISSMVLLSFIFVQQFNRGVYNTLILGRYKILPSELPNVTWTFLGIMEEKIQKQIIDYFSFFEEFYNTLKSSLKDCQNCAAAINKLIKRCRNIKQAAVAGTPLEEFDKLQNKLCASLHNLISEEVLEIRVRLSTIEELFEKLCNKNKALRESCKEINFEEKSLLVKGTPLQPSLKQLLEFAEESITFGSTVYALIETSLDVLTFKGLNTESLVDNFRISTTWQQRISEIIAYTSFCSQNQI